VRARLHCHRSELRRGIHRNPILQRAWDKYGEAAFRFAVLQGLKDTPELVIEREQFWIDKLGAADRATGYNINPIAGASPMQGRNHTDESKAKMSASKVGSDNSAATAAAAKVNKGRKHTAEECAAKSAALKGVPKSEEHKAKTKATHWSKRPDAAEIVARIVANRPKTLTPEHRARIAEGGRRRWARKPVSEGN
jgi:group I intron endonuclease